VEFSFTKLHGCSNDYLFADCTDGPLERAGEVSRIVSDRRRGVGSDGIILIYPSETADLRMEMYNADGSRGQMCGNGIRCLGKYAYEHRLVANDSLTVETDAGIKQLQLHIRAGLVESVTVDMGTPVGEILDHTLEVGDDTWNITCVSMGNPHAVTFDADPDGLDLPRLGPLFAEHRFFPNGTNTEFARIDTPTRISMRVWERGSGETMACGTGACAVVVAAVHGGLAQRACTVLLRGGQLDIDYRESGTVLMTGPAVEVFSASVTVELD
jgi:diaminopimelate epimerase